MTAKITKDKTGALWLRLIGEGRDTLVLLQSLEGVEIENASGKKVILEGREKARSTQKKGGSRK